MVENNLIKDSYILVIISSIFTILSILMVFFYAPMEKEMGIIQKIFYFHVPSAVNTFIAFLIIFICGIAFIATEKPIYDLLSLSAAEVGFLFCSMVLITGPLWAKSAWGIWWTWDPRLTTTLILWFIYIAYFFLRASIEDELKSARVAAVFGIIGFVDVPIVFLSIRLWRSIHPVVFSPGKIGLEFSMLLTLIICLFAFLLLMSSLIFIRTKIALQIKYLEELLEN